MGIEIKIEGIKELKITPERLRELLEIESRCLDYDTKHDNVKWYEDEISKCENDRVEIIDVLARLRNLKQIKEEEYDKMPTRTEMDFHSLLVKCDPPQGLRTRSNIIMITCLIAHLIAIPLTDNLWILYPPLVIGLVLAMDALYIRECALEKYNEFKIGSINYYAQYKKS